MDEGQLGPDQRGRNRLLCLNAIEVHVLTCTARIYATGGRETTVEATLKRAFPTRAAVLLGLLG